MIFWVSWETMRSDDDLSYVIAKLEADTQLKLRGFASGKTEERDHPALEILQPLLGDQMLWLQFPETVDTLMSDVVLLKAAADFPGFETLSASLANTLLYLFLALFQFLLGGGMELRHLSVN